MTNTSRRPRLTKAQRQARRDADNQLMEMSTQLIDDDEPSAELVAFMAARPGLTRLSLRNIALLSVRAEQRGTDSSDVQTYRQWQDRGRQVRKGERSYKIIVSAGTEDPEQSKQDPAPAEAAPTDQDQPEAKPRFRLKSGWFDRSQTDAIDDLPEEAAEQE